MRMKLVAAGVFVGLALAWSYPAHAVEKPSSTCYILDMTTISEATAGER
jgi:hypothetical protein